MDNQVLLEIAKDAIASKLDNSIKIDKSSLLIDYPFLSQKTATFVTLKLNNELRGCVGTLEARFSLVDDLITNARNAAFHDPRFYELSKEEFQKVDLEISILTQPIKLQYENLLDLKSKVKPFVHGVILTDGLKRATFLPQVWEQIPTFEDFFLHLCHKGNFPKDSFSLHLDVYVYEVNKVG